MLVKLKTTAGELYYKVYTDADKKQLVLRTTDYEEANARQLLIVAEEVTEWAVNRARCNPYTPPTTRKNYADNRLYSYLLRRHGKGLAIQRCAEYKDFFKWSQSAFDTYLTLLRRRGAISTKKVYNKKYIYIH